MPSVGNLRESSSPSLSIDPIASGLRISPRYIQMLFHDEETTFSEYLAGQRLARAWRVLADPRFNDQSITSVAFDCGFNDLSYFNRTFRKHFGCTPSEVRLRSARNNERRVILGTKDEGSTGTPFDVRKVLRTRDDVEAWLDRSGLTNLRHAPRFHVAKVSPLRPFRGAHASQ